LLPLCSALLPCASTTTLTQSHCRFAEYIKELTNSKSKIKHLPATADDPTQRKPDIAVAKRELGWEPIVDVRKGLQDTIAYFSQVLEEGGEIVPTGPLASKPKAGGNGSTKQPVG